MFISRMFHNYSHFKQCYGNSKFRASLVFRRVLDEGRQAARRSYQSRGLASYRSVIKFKLPGRVCLGNLKHINFQCLRRISMSIKPDRPRSGDSNEEPGSHKILFIASAFVFLYFLLKYTTDKPQTISWQYFLQEILPKGKVEQIFVVEDKDYAFVLTKDDGDPRHPQKIYIINLPEGGAFEEDIRKEETRLGIEPRKGVIVYHHHTHRFWKDIFQLLIGLFLFYLFKKGLDFSASGMNPFSNISRATFTLVDPLVGQGKGVKFSDVAGMQEAKQEIMEFVDYLKRPEHYNRLGARVPKGALLLGPPGCGKTLLAKAVATEANVPFLSMNGSEFIELIGGLGAARVRNLFTEARKRSPCIIYIDEIDTIGKKRATNSLVDGSQSEGDQTLNQLLVEMDGMASRDGVIMLASTNRSEILDIALLRPGRFDRHIMIDLPNQEERREIFIQHLKSIHLEMKPEFYARRMASLTPGFSGADIANICNEAALHAARYKKKKVTGEDLEYAVERVVGGIEKRSHAISLEEKRVVAYHEAGRALVGWLLETGEALLKISVVPRTRQIVGWTQFAKPEQVLFSQKELFDKMCISLGGRGAELLIFNRTSTKAEKDLRKVTRIAYAQVRQYGMNNLVGLVSFGDMSEFRVKPYSKQLAALIDEEVRKLVTQAHRQAESVLNENKEKLIHLAEALLKHETLNYDDIVKIIGAPPKGKKKLVEPFQFDLNMDKAAGPEPPPPPQQREQEEARNRNEDALNFNFSFA